jgi:hypothetical protein
MWEIYKRTGLPLMMYARSIWSNADIEDQLGTYQEYTEYNRELRKSIAPRWKPSQKLHSTSR